MVEDWVNAEFNEYELRILYKFCYKRRFCDNGHYDETSIVKNGVGISEVGSMREALKKLVRLNIVSSPKKQNRHDYCFPQENYAPALSVLKRYVDQHDFIDEAVLDLKYQKRG